MKFRNNTKLGNISFGIALVMVAYFLYTTFYDLFFPLDFNSSIVKVSFFEQYKYIIMPLILIVAGIDFIIGTITLFQKESNKRASVITIVICSPIVLPFLYYSLLGLIHIL